MIDRVGVALYAACVDFMIRFANGMHITYRDANALMFFVLWPAVTVALSLAWIAQRRRLARLGAGVSEGGAGPRRR